MFNTRCIYAPMKEMHVSWISHNGVKKLKSKIIESNDTSIPYVQRINYKQIILICVTAYLHNISKVLWCQIMKIMCKVNINFVNLLIESMFDIFIAF